jgi:hypothetical protein
VWACGAGEVAQSISRKLLKARCCRCGVFRYLQAFLSLTAFLANLQLYARLNDQVFRDELLWDVSNPQNTPDTYAMRVCGDLGLGCDWYDVIKGHLEMRLQEVRQVRAQGSGFGVKHRGPRAQGLGLTQRAQGSGFGLTQRAQGSGFGVNTEGPGLRVWG